MLFGNALGGSICGQDGGGKVFADPQFCATDPAASMSFLLQSDSRDQDDPEMKSVLASIHVWPLDLAVARA